MDRALEILGLLGLPAVIATMILARMGKRRRAAAKDGGDGDGGGEAKR